MSFINVRRSLKRYRADNPYSHNLLFFFLSAIIGLLKIVVVGVVLVSVWLFGSAWMNTDQKSPKATAVVVDDIRQQSAISEIQTASANSVTEAAQGQQNTGSREKDLPAVALFGDSWVLSQNSGSYTVQLGSSPDKGKLVDFATEVMVDEQAHIYAFKVSSIGNPIYGLALGLYPDLKSAQESINKLPSSYRQFDPWVRPISELQYRILRVRERLAL